MLARNGLGFRLLPFLDAVIEAYDSTFKDIALASVEPALKPIIEYINKTFDYDLRLYEHWKYSFVLLWLFFGSTARAASGMGTRITFYFYWIWAGFCALVFGVATGTQPFDSGSLFWICVTSIMLFELGRAANLAFYRLENHTWWGDFDDFHTRSQLALLTTSVTVAIASNQWKPLSGPEVFFLPFAVVSTVFVYFGIVRGRVWYGDLLKALAYCLLVLALMFDLLPAFSMSNSPSIVALLIVIILSSLENILGGLRWVSEVRTSDAPFLIELLEHSRVRPALDVLSVLGMACALVLLSAYWI